MSTLVDFEYVILNGFLFQRNEHGYLLFEGMPLGSLKYGHPALVAVMGEHYESAESFSAWLNQIYY